MGAQKGEVIDDLLLNGRLYSGYRQNGYENVEIIKNGCEYRHDWPCESAYDNVLDIEKRKHILTFYARNSYACIDHVYFTNNNLKCLCCTETLPLWLAEDDKLQCPNDRLVSDHLPIASMFEVIPCVHTSVGKDSDKRAKVSDGSWSFKEM